MIEGAEAVVEQLSAALDALAALDLDALSDDPLLGHVRGLVTAQRRLDAQLTRVVRRADARSAAEHDGAKTMRSWLRGLVRMSGAEAGRLVARGRALEHLPATERAFAAGELGADQVKVIAEIATPDNRDKAAAQEVDVAAIEAALVGAATGGTHRDLELATKQYVAMLDPDGPEPDPTEGRSVTLVQHPDGTWTVRGTLDQLGGEKVASALESIGAASRTAGDNRSRARRTGDSLVQLADLALASGELPVHRGVKPHVIVTLDHEDLAQPGAGQGAARTGMGATLSAARARWAACDSAVTRIVLDPEGLPIDVGRAQRVVPPHIRKAVELRDEHCVFAGCEAPRWFCDVHHVIEWINGGATSLDNSALLCERHHAEVHHGFRVERDDTAPPGQRWRTYRPDGSEIRLHPPPCPGEPQHADPEHADPPAAGERSAEAVLTGASP